MFDWWKRLFGEGYIYAEFTCTDGTNGRSRESYIGDPATFDSDEYVAKLKQEIWYKHRRRIMVVNHLRIV